MTPNHHKKKVVGSGTLIFQNQTRRTRFRLSLFLLVVIIGSWLWETHTVGFEFGNSIGHLIAGLIVLSISDRELAYGWITKLIQLRKGTK